MDPPTTPLLTTQTKRINDFHRALYNCVYVYLYSCRPALIILFILQWTKRSVPDFVKLEKYSHINSIMQNSLNMTLTPVPVKGTMHKLMLTRTSFPLGLTNQTFL